MASTFDIRGVIDGFFGPGMSTEPDHAWTHSERLRLIRAMGQRSQNTFVYACKTDAKHLMEWETPYTADEINQFAELASVAKSAGVRFVFSLSPGVGYNGKKAQLDTLVAKLLCLAQAGVRDFALMFDDYPSFKAMDDPEAAAAVQANAHNRAREAVEEAVAASPEADHTAREGSSSDVYESRWFFCPTLYCGTPPFSQRPRAYLQALNRFLEPKTCIMFTGSKVVAPTIDDTYARLLRGFFGSERRLVLWDNFPVNDYAPGYVYAQPYVGRHRRLPEFIDGIVANGESEFLAGMISLLTAFDYFNNTHAYDPIASLKGACRRMLTPGETGDKPDPSGGGEGAVDASTPSAVAGVDLADDLAWLAQHAPGSPLHQPGWVERAAESGPDSATADGVRSAECGDSGDGVAENEEEDDGGAKADAFFVEINKDEDDSDAIEDAFFAEMMRRQLERDAAVAIAVEGSAPRLARLRAAARGGLVPADLMKDLTAWFEHGYFEKPPITSPF